VRVAVLVAVALTVGCQATDVVGISEFPHDDRVVSGSITVVSWNAQRGSDPRFESDLSSLATANGPDFVFVQEARADVLTTKRIGGHFASREFLVTAPKVSLVSKSP
jgi:hypothetical protein